MLILTVSSAWADGYTCILFGNSTGVEGLTTDNFELTGALNFDRTLSDGTAMNLKGTAGKFWSNAVNNTTWENTVAIEEINTALLPADAEIKFSADYFKSGGWQFVATGAGSSTSTLKLTLTPYNEGDKIVLYAAISNSVSAVSNFSASGLDNMSMSYATNTGDGFSTTKSFSSATRDITIVKIQGELQSSKVVSLTSSNQKNGWQMVSYIVTPGDPKKTISYTLTDALGTQYNGTYEAVWNDDDTPLPKFDSAKGCTLENAVFADDGGNYTLSANIVFPFPISNETEKNPTAIQSALGESKWYANADGKLKANNKANTNPLYSNQDNWNWYIYPEFNDGVFTFKLYNVGAQKYIPANPSTNLNTETALSDDAGSFQFAEVRTDQYGFYLPSANKFLTINTSGTNQNVWLWSASGGHMGSTMSFPEAIRLANMRITNAGWATFWAPFAVEIPEGVKAYAGEMKEGWIRMNEITEGIIPENTGVVVAKEVEGDAFSADLKPSALQPDLIIPTCYSGNTTSEIMNVPAGDYLLQKQEDVVGWYKVSGNGFTLAPNRCYLAKGSVPEPNQSRTFFGFAPDDATGINSIATEAKTKADGKYMVKGQIVVVNAGKAYNMNGTEIK